MDDRLLTRVRLAAGVAIGSVAATVALVAITAPASADEGPATLPPDLVALALKPEDLLVTTQRKRRILRFSTESSNRGAGPLEIFPSAASANCDGDDDPVNDRDAAQRVFADTNASGLFEAGVDGLGLEQPVGCMRYHAAHDHWHVLDFARYELRRESTGERAAVTRKVGFCVGDNRLAFPGGVAPAKAAYPFGPPGSVGCDAAATQGLSVGWADIYLFHVPGQHLDVTEARRGRYCLVIRIDPEDRLLEADEDNNVRRTPIALNARRLTVSKLPGRCRS